MIFEYETLKLIWLFIIGSLMVGFALTGGYDLGVAALLIFIGKKDEERQIILKSIGPTWEGNQVWLITAAAAIFAAWPLAYAVSFSSFYLALLLILLALILRPPGLDYRDKLSSLIWRKTWDVSLFLAGSIPTFLLGVVFGNLFSGLAFYFDDDLLVHNSQSLFALLKPHAVFCGIASFSILLLHGTLFLQLKTHEPINLRARKFSLYAGMFFILSFAIAWCLIVFTVDGYQITYIPNVNEAFTPLVKEVIKKRGLWLNNYQQHPIGYMFPTLSMFMAFISMFFAYCFRAGFALISNGLAIISVFITIGFTLYPFIVPSMIKPHHSLTIWDATSSYLTLSWMFWAVLIFLPLVLSYTTWVFHVMRGKVEPNIHHSTY